MVFLFLSFIMMSAYSFFMCAWKKWKYEEALPITVSSIIGILLFSGFIKALTVGVVIICISMIFAILAGLVLYIRRIATKENMHCFFSKGFYAFATFYVFFF